MVGVHTDTLIAGGLEVCANSAAEHSDFEWMSVCAEDWDREELNAVCRQFEMSPKSMS